MSFSASLYATGVRLLTSYGQAFTATRDVITSFNPTTGDVMDGSNTTYTGYCYPDNYNSFNVDQINVKQQDIKLYVSSITAPLVNDIYTLDGVNYTALNVQKITAQGSTIIYVVQLRQ